jgi:hypothetical protein
MALYLDTTIPPGKIAGSVQPSSRVTAYLGPARHAAYYFLGCVLVSVAIYLMLG